MSADVVVVGAGSAGCVVAARLSEDPGCQVLLLEAGPDAPTAAMPPAISGANFFAALEEPGRTWPHLLARRTGSAPARPYVRGRGVGGSSTVNAMLALTGEADDYDRWQLPGWGWADVAPTFARLALPREVVEPGEQGAVDRALQSAAVAAGHPWCADPELAGAGGVGPAWLNRRSRRRVSAADAYLEPARDRPNLVVRPDALVDRVLLDGRRAGGVVLATGEVVRAGTVVVCAGAIHSPAVLLRSGVDRPAIGLGLADHPAASCTLLLRPQHRAEPDALAIGAMLRWSSGAPSAGLDLQLLSVNLLGTSDDLRAFGLVMAALMDVRSTGSVRLASNDPAVDPEVDLGLLGDAEDRRRLCLAVREMLRLVGSDAFADIAEAVVLDAEGTPPEAVGSDAALDEWLAAHLADYVHASGTCRMGRRSDTRAVVDADAEVIGYEGLAVVDASILPVLPRVNTHVPTVMLAEHVVARWRARRSLPGAG